MKYLGELVVVLLLVAAVGCLGAAVVPADPGKVTASQESRACCDEEGACVNCECGDGCACGEDGEPKGFGEMPQVRPVPDLLDDDPIEKREQRTRERVTKLEDEVLVLRGQVRYLHGVMLRSGMIGGIGELPSEAGIGGEL